MKPWDDPTLLKLFRRISGTESLVLSLYMTEQSVELLQRAIQILHPRWSVRRRHEVLRRLLDAIESGK